MQSTTKQKLNLKGVIDAFPGVDNTLKKEGWCAEASTTGAKFTAIDEAMEQAGKATGRKVSKAGDTMTGELAMSGNRIVDIGEPEADTDAATKGYVDEMFPVPVTHGGLGTSTAAGATSAIFGIPLNSVKEYPNAAGIYASTGTEIFSNLTQTHNPYGVLLIFFAGYGLHIYADAEGRMFFGYSGSKLTEPTTWKSVATT